MVAVLPVLFRHFRRVKFQVVNFKLNDDEKINMDSSGVYFVRL